MAERELLMKEIARGRSFLGRLSDGRDVIRWIETFCRSQGIPMAAFAVHGSVSQWTLGTFDPKQQVYITHTEQGFFEIVSCLGNVSQREGEPFVFAHAALADENGRMTGGRLFSDTLAYAVEIQLTELTGEPLARRYDDATGMLAW